MIKLNRVMRAVSAGLEAESARFSELPEFQLSPSKFRSLVRQNEICAAGWLLSLYGRKAEQRLGRTVLSALPHVELALVSRADLLDCVDATLVSLNKMHTQRVSEFLRVEPEDSAENLKVRISRLMSFNEHSKARGMLECYAARLGDAYSELETRLIKAENGYKDLLERKDLVTRGAKFSTGGTAQRNFQETDGHLAQEQVLKAILNEECVLDHETFDVFLSDTAKNAESALKTLKFLNNTLPSEYQDSLFEAAMPLPSVSRFVILSHWYWVEPDVQCRSMEEALGALFNPLVQNAIIRLLPGRLLPPQTGHDDRVLYEKLARLMAGISQYGESPLAVSARSDGIRVVGQRTKLSHFLVEQDYANATEGPVSGVEDALTERAKSWLRQQAENDRGLLILSSHSHPMNIAGLRLDIALADIGKPLMAVIAEAPNRGDAVIDAKSLEAARDDGYDVCYVGRHASERNDYANKYLTHLRAGGALHVAFDSRAAPGQRVVAPWYLRPANLPVFPAHLGVLSGANMCFAATWIDEGGRQVIDIVPIEPPKNGLSSRVNSLWFTQRIARISRQFVFEQKMPLHQNLIEGYGGLRPARNLVPIDTWLKSDAVQKSKLSWLGDHDPEQIALHMQTQKVTFGALASLSLRMANMLLHFQSVAPHHERPERAFDDQHRVLCLLPTSPAMIVALLGATAAGSLISIGLPEDPDAKLVERVQAFDPDLIVATASVWDRLLSSHHEMEHRNALIIDDACDEVALTDILESFPETTALPPYDRACPGYVVYTSGSSGEPKGVVLASGVSSRMTLYDFDEVHTFLTIIRWDTGTALEKLALLRDKHALLLPPEEASSNLKALCDLMIETSVTVLSSPCSVVYGLLKNPDFSPQRLPGLKVFCPWGETLREGLVNGIFDRFPESEIKVSYGATEYLEVSWGDITIDDLKNYKGSPCGLPMPVARAVDADGNPLKPGEIGRIECLGYDRTLGIFKDLRNGARMFDPAEDPILLDDWVMVLPDGTLDVLGRIDDVINVRGRRLSLNDVASVVESVPGVGRVFVTSIVSRGTEAIAIAIETNRQDGDVLESEIRSAVTRELFAGAVPQRYLHLVELPQLPSGKLDRKQLSHMLKEETSEFSVNVASQEEKVLDAQISLSPMLTLLREFASEQGFVPVAKFDANRVHPFLDSILSLILMLSIEKRFGILPEGAVFDRQEEATWTELAERLETALRQKQVNLSDQDILPKALIRRDQSAAAKS